MVVIKLSCLTQLGMKFIPLINVKMQTILYNSTFISSINKTSARIVLKQAELFILRIFSFMGS